MTDVDALLREREGYVRRGLRDRVAQIDAALSKFGIGVEDAVETAVVSAPEAAVRRGPGRPRKIRD